MVGMQVWLPSRDRNHQSSAIVAGRKGTSYAIAHIIPREAVDLQTIFEVSEAAEQINLIKITNLADTFQGTAQQLGRKLNGVSYITRLTTAMLSAMHKRLVGRLQQHRSRAAGDRVKTQLVKPTESRLLETIARFPQRPRLRHRRRPSLTLGAPAASPGWLLTLQLQRVKMSSPCS